jgi:mono/diheme cytochrome c family protein
MSADPSDRPQGGADVSGEDLPKVHPILLREKSEPTENNPPLPLALLGLMGAVVLFAAFYLGRYSGGFDPLVYDERILPGMLESGAAPVAQDPRVIGRRLFSNCMSCHQGTGLGMPGQYPPLAGSDWALGPEDRVIRIVLNGLSGPITVKNTSFNGSMPAFGPLLRDEQIADVLTYVRSEWGNNAPAVSPEKVKEIRSAVSSRTAQWASEELLKIP